MPTLANTYRQRESDEISDRLRADRSFCRNVMALHRHPFEAFEVRYSAKSLDVEWAMVKTVHIGRS